MYASSYWHWGGCAAVPLLSKLDNLVPFWDLPQLLLKDWGRPNFFFLCLLPYPLPGMSLMPSYNGQHPTRKLDYKYQYVQHRCQPEREASKDPGGQKRKLFQAIEDFTMRGSKSLQVSPMISIPADLPTLTGQMSTCSRWDTLHAPYITS